MNLLQHKSAINPLKMTLHHHLADQPNVYSVRPHKTCSHVSQGDGETTLQLVQPELGPKLLPTLSDTEVDLYKMLGKQWILQTR